MVSHPLKSSGQIGISIASWECSTMLLGKLVLNCVIVVEPEEFISHDFKLILYNVSGQTHPKHNIWKKAHLWKDTQVLLWSEPA